MAPTPESSTKSSATPKPWKFKKLSPGIYEVTLESWNHFPDFVTKEFLDFRVYVFRGHRKASWRLTSTLARMFAEKPPQNIAVAAEKHLNRFKLATRGRRGPNPAPLASENDWWALGQHYGLSTPLLDWSTSPYVAAYFAFSETGVDDEEYRAIYVVSRSLEKANSSIAAAHSGPQRAPIVEFFSPQSDENGRLVNQGGLFTRGPIDIDLEDWVAKHFPETHKTMLLVKIMIPNSDRELCLRSLNRMNINHLSLFPDLDGASVYANMELQITKY